MVAYRYGDRKQIELLPQCIEEYVGEEDPVRVYDAFVEALDMRELGIDIDENKVGNPEYDPKAMLKLLVYGYSYGIRSSRKLERAVNHNLSFIWLMGGLRPDHKPIAEFRRTNKEAIRNVMKQCARLCMKLGLIDGNTLFVDGSRIRANASISKTWDKKRCEKVLEAIDRRIDLILSECERADKEEEESESLVKLKDELKDKMALKMKVEDVMKELKEEGIKSRNTTDPDCVKVKSRQGTHAGYNSQVTVDEKRGFIVSADVVSESNDANQLVNQIQQANEVLGKKCEVACADAGYANTDQARKIDEQGITVIVPTKKQVHGKPEREFGKEQFRYNIEDDSYTCPEGQKLKYEFTDKTKNHRVYRVSGTSICSKCKYFGKCTKSKNGRRIRRLMNEDVKMKLEEQYKKRESQAIYKHRKEKVELIFGHIKRNLGVGAFLLRGLQGVRAEMSILASCFNITRMINIIGIRRLIERLAA